MHLSHQQTLYSENKTKPNGGDDRQKPRCFCFGKRAYAVKSCRGHATTSMMACWRRVAAVAWDGGWHVVVGIVVVAVAAAVVVVVLLPAATVADGHACELMRSMITSRLAHELCGRECRLARSKAHCALGVHRIHKVIQWRLLSNGPNVEAKCFLRNHING